MKTFEVSSKRTKNGRRKFKVILHEIYPDECIDEASECGTVFNDNGITWIERYCQEALSSIKDMSVRVEFLDEDRTQLCGHGMTDIKDGMPVFENADVIGHFTKGYITKIEDENGNEKTVCCGEGYLDEMCYANYIAKLEEEIENNSAPFGSVEIFRTENNDGIKYLYGYKEQGRIPTEFIYSGYALLGVAPADHTAKILELNSKEENTKMNEQEIKNLIAQTVNEMSNHTAEMNSCKDDCEQKIAEANAKVESISAEMNELQASSEALQKALDEAREELSEKYKEIDALYEELNELREALGKARAKERVGEMNSAIASFTDEEKAYAQAEIDAFNNDPIASEINSVVNKIWEGIGKKAKAEEVVVIEQNAANIEDIFGEITIVTSSNEDENIF